MLISQFTNDSGYITSSGSISGNAATATNILNTGTVTLATATESNSIFITQPSYSTNQPVKLLNFDWYGETWQMGNIRSSGATTAGFGIYLSGSEKFRFNRDGEAIFQNRVTTTAWSTSGRNYSYEWIQFPNYSGLYSPNNNAHFLPNNSTFGPWKVIGDRNGFNGLEFECTSNGNISLMIAPNSNQVGFHNNNNGWLFYFSGGELKVSKATYGDYTLYTVLDAANFNTYAAALYHTHDLGRYSLQAPAYIDGLTTTNFRNTLFGLTSNTFNISTARWNTTPTALPGMGSYGTMLAWSGADTQGFIATNYNTAVVTVGGGNGSNINWSALLLHSSNYSEYALPLSGGTIAGDLTVSNKVYIGTNGCYFQEVLIGSVYEIQVVDSVGNITVLS
jgi:hypothetical protein